ncbi:MAG: PAS domain S-box protein [Nitrosomonadales bacterium]|nr:PAS domain S-box protein [Nitrosomonadales bacterium]
MALRGETEVREGVDYRGVPVLAATRMIPGTDWIMEAKIDQDEIYGALATQRGLLVLFALLLVTTTGITLRLYWRRQQRIRLEQQYRELAERQALRSHYETILEHANDIFMLADDHARIVDTNQRAIEMTGYSRDELLSMDIRQLRSPRAREMLAKQWQFGTEGTVFETELQRKDGSTFPVEVSARVIEVEGENFRQGIIRDISERKQTEEAIRHSRDLLRSVVENAPVRVFWKDRDLRYLGCNTAFAQDAGMTHPQELYGKDDFQMGWRDRAEQYRADDRRVMESGEPKIGSEEPVTMPDGRTIWLRTSKVPLRDTEGRVSGVLGIYEDITDEKVARDQLEQERDFSNGLVETAQVIILVLDPQGRIVRMNPFMEALCGYTSHEVEGRDWFDIFLPETDRAQMKALFQGAVGDIQTHGNVNTLLTRDGRQRLVEWYDKTLKDDAGNVVGLLSIGLDVTERKQHEIALQRANRALKTQSAVNLALVQAQSEEDLLLSVTNVIAEQGGYLIAWVGYAEHDAHRSVRVVGQSGFGEMDIDPTKFTWADTEEGQGPTGTAIRTSVTVINPDLLNNPDGCHCLEAAIKRGCRSAIAIPLTYTGQMMGALTIYAAEPSAFSKEEVKLLEELAGDLVYGITNMRTRAAHEHHASLLRRSLEQSVQTIASTVEARDPYTAGHQRRVAVLAVAIARQMGLPKQRIKGLHLAAIVHDLGKIRIPAEILSKPGKLSDIEFSLIKFHPQAGYDILKDVEFPWPIADMVLQHHERLDGSGYPQGLKGDAILLEARILCVADVVEAMSSHRPYRPGLGTEAALGEIERNKGRLYDPSVVDACIKLFREGGFEFGD